MKLEVVLTNKLQDVLDSMKAVALNVRTDPAGNVETIEVKYASPDIEYVEDMVNDDEDDWDDEEDDWDGDEDVYAGDTDDEDED